MSAVSDIVDRLRGLQVDALLGLRPPYPPVAVEFDREEAVLVRVKHKRRGKPLLEAHAVRSLPTDCIPASIFQQPAGASTELVGRLRELFEVTGTRPGRVSLVLPDNLAKVSLLTLPERPASQRQHNILDKNGTPGVQIRVVGADECSHHQSGKCAQ